jgi:hypothetical protein
LLSFHVPDQQIGGTDADVVDGALVRSEQLTEVLCPTFNIADEADLAKRF